MTFSERLMQLRKQRGWSQEQLGEQLHVTRQTVSKWETGATTPELNKLIELSELFELSIDELVGRTPPTQTEQTISYAARFPQAFFEYKSQRMLFGMPLVHINVGHGHIGGICRAKGVVAIGNVATGIVAMGGFSLGVISIGGFSVGLLSLGGAAMGLLAAIGGLAVGGLVAVGGMAIGMYAFGGAATAVKLAVGDYAQGTVAIGNQTNGTICLNRAAASASNVRRALTQAFPHMWSWLKDFLCALAEAYRQSL